MPSSSRIWVFILLTVFLITALACQPPREGRRGGDPPPVVIDDRDVSSFDDATPFEPDVRPVDDASNHDPELPGEPLPCGGCPSGEVCVDEVCQRPAEECPCSPETYCDLATNRCLPGCIADDDCASGRICESDARTCRAGCRAHDDCSASRPVCEEATWTCREGCLDNAGCTGELRCSNELFCVDGCLDGEPMVDGGCLLQEVCDIQRTVFGGGDCSTNSTNHDSFAHWWCALAGYTSALSYEVLTSGIRDAVYYSGGDEAVLSSCDQVEYGSYGIHSNCTAVTQLICVF